MPILQAFHASNIWVVVEIVSIEHLLNRLDALGQETAFPRVLALTAGAVAPHVRRTVIHHMAPLVAAIAYCFLRAFISAVINRQAKLAAYLVKTSIVMMSDFFTTKASHIALEIPVYLLLVFLLFISKLICPSERFLAQGELASISNFLLQVRCLGLAVDIGSGDLVCVDGGRDNLTLKDVVTPDGDEPSFGMNFVHEVLDDGKLLIGGELALVRHRFTRNDIYN
jgi:hypothetical protein